MDTKHSDCCGDSWSADQNTSTKDDNWSIATKRCGDSWSADQNTSTKDDNWSIATKRFDSGAREGSADRNTSIEDDTNVTVRRLSSWKKATSKPDGAASSAWARGGNTEVNISNVNISNLADWYDMPADKEISIRYSGSKKDFEKVCASVALLAHLPGQVKFPQVNCKVVDLRQASPHMEKRTSRPIAIVHNQKRHSVKNHNVKVATKSLLALKAKKATAAFNKCCPVCRKKQSGNDDLFHWMLEEDKKVNMFHELNMQCETSQLKTSRHKQGFNAVFNKEQFPALKGSEIYNALQSVQDTLLFNSAGEKLKELFSKCVHLAVSQKKTNMYNWNRGKSVQTFAVECQVCRAYCVYEYPKQGRASQADRLKAARLFVAFLMLFSTSAFPPEGEDDVTECARHAWAKLGENGRFEETVDDVEDERAQDGQTGNAYVDPSDNESDDADEDIDSDEDIVVEDGTDLMDLDAAESGFQ